VLVFNKPRWHKTDRKTINEMSTFELHAGRNFNGTHEVCLGNLYSLYWVVGWLSCIDDGPKKKKKSSYLMKGLDPHPHQEWQEKKLKRLLTKGQGK